MSKTTWIALLLLVTACGGGGKSSSSSPSRPPVLPDERTPEQGPSEERPDIEVNQGDLLRIADVLPTMYYVPKESDVSCRGRYGDTSFNGAEKSIVRTMNGTVLATVCTRFFRHLIMEGTAILKNRGQGEQTINYSGSVGDEKRFHVVDRCALGEGIRRDLCLLPHHTIAADNRIHKIGDIIYLAEVDGLRLPDGSLHDGYFIVRDTGSAFNGVGDQRIDLFVGLEPDFNNTFQRAGMHHRRPMKAYKVIGESAERVKQQLKDRFGELY